MIYAPPSCPSCSADLVHLGTGDFDSWMCRFGHGLAVSPVAERELHGAAALATIWERARLTEPASDARRSPRTGAPMVSVRVGRGTGSDNTAAAPGSDLLDGAVWLDVDVWSRLIWIDDRELTGVAPGSRRPTASKRPADDVGALRRALSGPPTEGTESTGGGDVAEQLYRRIAARRGLTDLLGAIPTAAAAQPDTASSRRPRAQASGRSRAAVSRAT